MQITSSKQQNLLQVGKTRILMAHFQAVTNRHSWFSRCRIFFAKPKAKSNYFVFWRWSWRKCFSLSFHFSHPHINCCYQSYLNFSFSYLFIAFSFRTRAYDDVLCFVAKMPRFSRITNAKKWNNTFKAELHKKAAKFLMRIFPTPARNEAAAKCVKLMRLKSRMRATITTKSG